MPTKQLDPNKLGHADDWEDNNATFKCPHYPDEAVSLLQ